MSDITTLAGSYWWVIFIIPPVFGGMMQKHHRRRLAVLEAKSQLAEKRNARLQPPPEPQAICGCSHHLSFHNPRTSACAVDDCRCQQYVGPEPLGHVFALPLIDPELGGGGEPPAAGPPASQPWLSPPPAAPDPGSPDTTPG